MTKRSFAWLATHQRNFTAAENRLKSLKSSVRYRSKASGSNQLSAATGKSSKDEELIFVNETQTKRENQEC